MEGTEEGSLPVEAFASASSSETRGGGDLPVESVIDSLTERGEISVDR